MEDEINRYIKLITSIMRENEKRTFIEELKRPEVVACIKKYGECFVWAIKILEDTANKDGTFNPYAVEVLEMDEVSGAIKRGCDDDFPETAYSFEDLISSNVDKSLIKAVAENFRYKELDFIHVVDDLIEIAEHTKDKDAIKSVVEALKKYEKKSSQGVSGAIGYLASKTKNRDDVIYLAEVMGRDEIVKCVERYRSGGEWSSPDENVPYLLALIASQKRNDNDIRIAVENLTDFDSTDYSRELVDIGKNPNGIDAVLDLCRSMNNLKDRDPATAQMIGENSESIIRLFGDKYKGILSYLEKRRDRDSILTIGRVENTERVGGVIDKIRLASLGNKQAAKLIKLSYLLDVNYGLGLEPETSEDLNVSLEKSESSLRDYMSDLYIEFEKGMKFLPWIKEKDPVALKVLRGERVEKVGIPRTYELDNGSEIDVESLKKEIQSYANMAGLNVGVEDGDLTYLKSITKGVLSSLERKKDISPEVLAEVKPNLSRILNLTHRGSKNYVLSVNPSDMESQLEALQNVGSCLSPGGAYFQEYTQMYLENPNVFWAVIKDSDGKIVGRVTVFHGRQDGNDVVARTSKIYSLVPISQRSVDRALKMYAEDMNIKFIDSGKMVVDGLVDAYDDYADWKDNRVVIDKSRARETFT